MDQDKDLIRLASFEFEYEALLLRNELNDLGIPAWVTGGDGVNIFGAGLTAAGLVGVDVNVRRIDLKAAEEIEKTFRDRAQKEEKVPNWTCACGEEIEEGFAVCWSCGAEFGQPEGGDGESSQD